MSLHRRTLPLVLMACAFMLVTSTDAWACAVCFGAPDSPQTQAMNMAIVTMLGVTGSVLGMMSGAGIFLWRRSIALNRDAGSFEDAGVSDSEKPGAARDE